MIMIFRKVYFGTFILISRSINTEISLLAIILKLGLILMLIDISILSYQPIWQFKLTWWLLRDSISLLWVAYDSTILMRFTFFYKLKDMSLNNLIFIEWWVILTDLFGLILFDFMIQFFHLFVFFYIYLSIY